MKIVNILYAVCMQVKTKNILALLFSQKDQEMDFWRFKENGTFYTGANDFNQFI